MERILDTVGHFDVPALVCINKHNIHPEGTQQIEIYCKTHHIEMIGKIPFNEDTTHEMVNGIPITKYLPESNTSKLFENLWQQIRIKAKP